ncbi:hypothetical protein PLEOSDRAFT_159227 [Pleurotus ostreatus PC15]|uniref:Uncharacterized protein n=1 Tax=Pleurotus ostreatus (strain PC15) TaxID=1137138 RepID=A0A067NFS0_PLEO1|nr:hypothetical protein PLEOSDRAFT_159227 [Pleurotus ostreatus PC15]
MVNSLDAAAQVDSKVCLTTPSVDVSTADISPNVRRLLVKPNVGNEHSLRLRRSLDANQTEDRAPRSRVRFGGVRLDRSPANEHSLTPLRDWCLDVNPNTNYPGGAPPPSES